jgi:nitrite reductase/ring-hydroxylating ferredoxin subunit
MSGETTNTAKPGVPEHQIGRLADFPPHKVATVEVGGRKIGVLRKGDAVYAFANRCPHQGGPMCSAHVAGTMFPSEPDEYNFGLDGLVVKCPWHAYEFDVQTGESMGGIIKSRLLVYQTEVRGEAVFCRLTRATGRRMET